MPFTIEPCHREDLWAVVSVNVQTLPEHYVESFWINNLALFPDTFYVAKISGIVVGYVMCNLMATVYEGKHVTAGHVASIAVLPQFRNQGIATALLQKAYEGIKKMGLRHAVLEVRLSNQGAVALYQKEGFKTTTTIPRYYSDGESGLLMAKALV